MKKKYWAYLAIGLGLLMIWAISQVNAGKVDATTSLGKLQNELATLALSGSMAAGAAPGSTTATTPFLAYGLMGVGAWLLFA